MAGRPGRTGVERLYAGGTPTDATIVSHPLGRQRACRDGRCTPPPRWPTGRCSSPVAATSTAAAGRRRRPSCSRRPAATGRPADPGPRRPHRHRVTDGGCWSWAVRRREHPTAGHGRDLRPGQRSLGADASAPGGRRRSPAPGWATGASGDRRLERAERHRGHRDLRPGHRRLRPPGRAWPAWSTGTAPSSWPDGGVLVAGGQSRPEVATTAAAVVSADGRVRTSARSTKRASSTRCCPGSTAQCWSSAAPATIGPCCGPPRSSTRRWRTFRPGPRLRTRATSSTAAPSGCPTAGWWWPGGGAGAELLDPARPAGTAARPGARGGGLVRHAQCGRRRALAGRRLRPPGRPDRPRPAGAARRTLLVWRHGAGRRRPGPVAAGAGARRAECRPHRRVLARPDRAASAAATAPRPQDRVIRLIRRVRRRLRR